MEKIKMVRKEFEKKLIKKVKKKSQASGSV
jgi:hypothetical protein